MSEYVLLIVSVSVIGAFIRVLSPNSQNVMLAVRLVLICAILTPIIKLARVNDINENLFVINEELQHSITNEDADVNWRRWVAESTASKLSEDISSGLKDTYGIDARVVVPWREEGDGIVFEVIRVYANVDDGKKEKIKTWINLHYSLKSVCINGESGDG